MLILKICYLFPGKKTHTKKEEKDEKYCQNKKDHLRACVSLVQDTRPALGKPSRQQEETVLKKYNTRDNRLQQAYSRWRVNSYLRLSKVICSFKKNTK